MFTLAPGYLTGTTNQVDSLKEDLESYGASFSWAWKDEIVSAEYIHSKTGDLSRHGWYIWGGHSFRTHLGFLEEVQILARYEQYDSDLNQDGNRIDRITIGSNFIIDGKYTKIQANYHIIKEEGLSVKNNQFATNIQVAF